jgi:hypothetical protein
MLDALAREHPPDHQYPVASLGPEARVRAVPIRHDRNRNRAALLLHQLGEVPRRRGHCRGALDDPAPGGLEHPVHQAKTVGVVARDVGAVGGQDVRHVEAPGQRAGQRPRGHDEVGMDDVRLDGTDQLRTAQVGRHQGREQLRRRRVMRMAPDAGCAVHDDAFDRFLGRQSLHRRGQHGHLVTEADQLLVDRGGDDAAATADRGVLVGQG